MTSIYRRAGRRGFTVQYRDPTTRRLRQRAFRLKRDAQMFEETIRAKERVGLGLDPDITFRAYAERWLTATQTAVRLGTDAFYRGIVANHLVPAFGPLHLQAITQRHVRELVVKLRQEGLAKKTIGNIRSSLHAMLAGAVEEGYIATNPATFRSRSKLMSLAPTAGELRAKVKALDEGQVRAFLAAAPSVAPRYHLAFRTMVSCGLRPGEALGLQPRDLEYERGRIRLERAVTPARRVEPCKTSVAGEWEYVDLPPRLAADLRAWERGQQEAGLATGRPRSTWLFPTADGRSGEHGSLRAEFKRVLRVAKLPPHFTPNSLRHTYASQQLAAGESVYYVSRQLRHADIRITVTRYGSWLPAGNQDASARHEARILGVSDLSASALKQRG